ncbi:centriole and centriolar satellite protein OFD1 [Topomyia yanbarensis]|uniref:centriole and centriolar satellite protein OFD1 n=1 Tax=Topomyia yanbarensis TaxID=2498891 RepID=UPI00273BD865|nr:centriole and centriolar satellite protein OFD1 [Topomyia yanbarensis]
MNCENEFVDLDRITNSEFRQHIKSWIEEQGINANLQLQMKKDLIDQISRTALGRKMSLKLQTHQGIVLSPLVLVLNTLVAEFLYTQNCHFTLSVFSNEVPFKNTLPDFTKSTNFRLQRTELREIFEALGIEHYSGLVEKYESKTTKDGAKSLIYIIFKSMLASVKSYENKIKSQQKQEVERETNKSLLNELGMEKLHRNVEKLLHRVKVVNKSIERIEELHRNDNREDSREEETQSLKVCTENVQKLVSKLEICSSNFERVVEKLQEQTEQKIEVVEEKPPDDEAKKPAKKTYTDFLNELKSTEYGKKYVAKLQKQILKLMDKEKALIEAKFLEKLHRAELEYKSKLENLLSERIKELPVDVRRSPKLPNQTDETEESTLFMKKIDEKLDMLYQHEKNVNEKLVTLKDNLEQQERRHSKHFQTLKAAETKEKRLLVLQDVERQLLATFEDETQAVVRNAKATIEQLESENNRINRSFQLYLHKQREDKRKLNDEKVQIWQKYNEDKLEFNQRELMEFNESSQTVPVIKEVVVPHNDDFPKMPTFENPFRNFDPRKYLKRSKVCNIQFVPEPLDVVDVAVNTSFEPNPQSSSVAVRGKTPNNVNFAEAASLWDKETTFIPTDKAPKPSSAESQTNVNCNTSKERNAPQAESKLSKLLATDTRNLKKSIEKNLQKLDQMSKTYTKSSTSSSDRQENTYNIKPTIETEKIIEKASLDDLSSAAELELSDKDLPNEGSPKERTADANVDILNLNTTRELLDFARDNFPIDDGMVKETGVNKEKKLSLELMSLGSLSDLDISGDSQSVHVTDGADSSLDRLEQISTGQRSGSDKSWS